MLTIFTIPKPFIGQFKIIQENAIQSWLRLDLFCTIILMGDDEGVGEVARKYNLIHISKIAKNEYGTPLLNSAFHEAERVAKYSLMCYINSDIILTKDFIKAIQEVVKQIPCSLMVGRRIDVNIPYPINFSSEWEDNLLKRIHRKVIHRGIDYFVFPKGLYKEIPPFAIGRPYFDNWLIYYANSKRVPTIDLTEVFLAIHSEHDYSHYSLGKKGVLEGPEAEINCRLLGSYRRMHTTLDAKYKLSAKGIVKNKGNWISKFKIVMVFYFYKRLVFLSNRYQFLKPVISAMKKIYKLRRLI